MNPISSFHSHYVHTRRVRVLAELLSRMLPAGVSVLDVGSGDGRIASEIKSRVTNIEICGVDVLVRPDTSIAVTKFDGKRLPFQEDEFDTVLFVDVLHHCEDPLAMLAEAARVASRAVVIKDHLVEGWLAWETLKFMDRMGNAKHGVALPHNYYTRDQWQSAFTELKLSPYIWNERVPLYPWPASLVFSRSLHFVASLDVCPSPCVKPVSVAFKSR